MKLPELLRLRFSAPAATALATGALLAVDPTALWLVLLGALLVLPPLQTWAYWRYRKAARAGDVAAREWALDCLGVGAALLAGDVAVVASAWWQLAAWPSEGSLLSPLVAVFCATLLYQLVLLGHWAVRRRLPLRRWSWRVLTLVAGLALFAAVDGSATRHALTGLGERYASLLRSLAASPTSCDDFRRYLLEYSGRASQRPRSLHFGAGRALLTFAGGSADLDGSTIVFDSSQPAPTLFHNDDRRSRQELVANQASLEDCSEARPSEPASAGSTR